MTESNPDYDKNVMMVKMLIIKITMITLLLATTIIIIMMMITITILITGLHFRATSILQHNDHITNKTINET